MSAKMRKLKIQFSTDIAQQCRLYKKYANFVIVNQPPYCKKIIFNK